MKFLAYCVNSYFSGHTMWYPNRTGTAIPIRTNEQIHVKSSERPYKNPQITL